MIRLEHTPGPGSVAEMVFDRPAKRNALTVVALCDLERAVESLGRADVGAVLLRGAGSVFCSGFDLAECVAAPTALPSMLTSLSRAARGLRRLRVPVVVAAQGAAVAGGCALAGAADVVVTHADARLGYPVLRIGVSPAVTVPLLQQSTGPGASRALLLSPSPVRGVDAVRIGLAHELTADSDEVLPRARAVASSLASKPPRAVRTTKAWLNELDRTTIDADFDAALKASLSVANSPEQARMLIAALQR